MSLALNFELHERQSDALLSPATQLLYGGSAGGGKALALSTVIPTPDGWSTMGDLKVGDYVFDKDGHPTKIIATTAIIENRDCYEIEFANGEVITADAQHQWITQTEKERIKSYRSTNTFRAKRRLTRPSRGKGIRPSLAEANRNRQYEYQRPLAYKIRTTEQINKTIFSSRGRKNHSIPINGALDLPYINLPIDPYVLGAWLGDGNSDGVGFTSNDQQILKEIETCGYQVSKRKAKYAWGILGLTTQLKYNNLLKNKHIPSQYLRSSSDQRRALLQGLMDTDGHCTLHGDCEFDNTSETLARQVYELVISLGMKANLLTGKAKLKGRIIGNKYRVTFIPDSPCFRLERKLKRQRKPWSINKIHYIKSIKRVPSVPVRCIEVESVSGTYLAGRSMIVTHNSHLSRVLAILWAMEIPGLQIYFFRRLYDDLVKNHLEGPTGFRSMLAPWINAKHPQSPLIGGKLADVVDGEVRFWNGSKIFLCHLQHQKDLTKYYGPEFHVLFLEEATQFTEFMIRFLMSRLRIPTSLKIPKKYLRPKEHWRSKEPEYLFPRTIMTSNPGGVGHSCIKRWFMGHKPYELHFAPKDEGGHLRQYIPARVDDNPSINREEYKANLAGLPPVLVDALLNGNWNAVIGAFFPELSPAVHLIKPFKIPDHWVRLMSMDWGACGEGDPFAICWWAISDGSIPMHPRDTAIMYKLWYGRGLPKVTVHEVARGIQSRELGEPKILDRVAGGDILEQRGTGPSIYEMFREYGIHFRRADMRRVSGWQQVRDRLVGKDNIPRMYFFNQYAPEIETIQTLQHDLNDPNDAAAGDDHIADSARYFCMMRPWSRVLYKTEDSWKNYNTPTLDQMWEKYEQTRQE